MWEQQLQQTQKAWKALHSRLDKVTSAAEAQRQQLRQQQQEQAAAAASPLGVRGLAASRAQGRQVSLCACGPVCGCGHAWMHVCMHASVKPAMQTVQGGTKLSHPLACSHASDKDCTEQEGRRVREAATAHHSPRVLDASGGNWGGGGSAPCASLRFPRVPKTTPV